MSTDKHWEEWGKTNPYYGVLSDDKFRGKSIDDNTLEAFFKSGEEYMASSIAAVTDLKKDFAPRCVLDFGCGVGRLLVPLAERFDEIVGLDVSPSMLAEAEKHVSRFKGRVTLALSDDKLSNIRENFDFIHSVIVFQHIPTNRGMKIVKGLLSHLNKGGVVMLHFPYERNASLISKMLHLVRRVIPGVHPILNIARGRPLSDPIMEMNCYNIADLLTAFSNHGIEEIHMKIHPEHTGYRTATLIGIRSL